MSGAYAREVAAHDLAWSRQPSGYAESSGRPGGPRDGQQLAAGSAGSGGHPAAYSSEHSHLRSPIRSGLPEAEVGRMKASLSTHMSSSDPLDRSLDGLLKAPILPKDLSHAQRAFEHVQTELLLQTRRQDDLFESVARVEADLSRVAKLAVENEDLHARERQQKQTAFANLTRKTEEALLTCETLRKGQESLIQKVERLETFAEDRERQADEVRMLQREVDSLQVAVREKLDGFGHALRRLDAMELIFDENTKLRQEVTQLRRSNERRDLEMAAVQGQIDALTKLVREQLREPLPMEKGDAPLTR